MYDILKAAHDGIRWIVVLMAIIVLIKTLAVSYTHLTLPTILLV